MSDEKRSKMALNSKNMPNDVYEILNEKSKKRSLTPFIIELVQERLRAEKAFDQLGSIENKKVFEQLSSIENKIDIILSGNFNISKSTDIDNEEENYLKEGTIIEANNVIGQIDDSDKVEIDY